MTKAPITLTNWAGNITFAAARVHRPSSVEQVQQIVAASDKVRALGSGHSFSPVADTTGDLVSVAGLPHRIELATDRRTVTVSAGLRYGQVATALDAAGLALPNLGSLPHISVAGAVATGTHGSGDGHGSMSSAVTGLEVVTATGELRHVGRADGDRLAGAVVALGALGVVTAVELAVEPTYDVSQQVHEDLSLTRLAAHLDEVFAAGDSVSVFTGWRGEVAEMVWVKRRTEGSREPLEPDWLGTRLATRPRHPIPGKAGEECTRQLGVPGRWHERWPHFRLDHQPSSGAELQSEYLVPRGHAVAALTEVAAMRAQLAPVVQVCELRTVAADGLWLSPAYDEEGAGAFAVHHTWVPDLAAVAPVVAELERRLIPLGARPHWGKVFGAAPQAVQARYPRLADFQALRRELDPRNVFGNPMVDAYLG